MANALLLAAQSVAAEPAAVPATEETLATPSAAFLAFLADVVESDDGLVDALDMAEAPDEDAVSASETEKEEVGAGDDDASGDAEARERVVETFEGGAS